MSKYLRKTPEQLAQEMLAISQALELMNKEEAEALGTISKRYVDSISEPKKAEAYLKFLDQYATKEEKKRLKNRINILKKLAKQDDTDSKQLVVDDKNANKIQPAFHQKKALDDQIVKESGINYNNDLTTNLVDN
jgi:thioredoxin-like negative regulator of GroEL